MSPLATLRQLRCPQALERLSVSVTFSWNQGTLEIFKFNDLNGNGVYEPPDLETPLAQLGVTLSPGPRGYGGFGNTNSSGLIIKTGLVPGDYTNHRNGKPPARFVTTQTTLRPVPGEPENGGKRLNFGNQYTYRPPNLPQAVGGEASPVNKVAVVMPWLIVLAVGAGVAVVARRRLSSNR